MTALLAADAAQDFAQLESGLRHWIDQARAHYGLSAQQLPYPALRIDLRGQRAGVAQLARSARGQDVIRLNKALLATHWDEMLGQTLPHEVAHVAVHRFYDLEQGIKTRSHGQEWQVLMAAFGLPATVTHQMPTQPARKLRRYAYRCGCETTTWLTSIRHNRVRKGTRYICRRCGQILELDKSA